jgi:hypothetical protein
VGRGVNFLGKTSFSTKISRNFVLGREGVTLLAKTSTLAGRVWLSETFSGLLSYDVLLVLCHGGSF